MLKKIEKKDLINLIIQFIKFGIVGAINTILSYLITNINYYIFNLHAQLSNIIAFIITVFISYMLNSKYVFKFQNQNFWKSLIKVYTSYSITGLFLTALLIYIEEEFFGIPHYIATFMNLIITIPINFILNKFWAYKDNKTKKEIR